MLSRALLVLALIMSPVTSGIGQSAAVDAPLVRVLSADLGPMARLEFSWPGPFHAEIDRSDRQLVLRFDQEFNSPFVGALRQRLANWVVGVDKRARSIAITTRQDAEFAVQIDGNVLAVEITARPARLDGTTAAGGATAALNLQPPGRAKQDATRDRSVVLVPPGGSSTARVPAVPAPAPVPNRDPAVQRRLDAAAERALKLLRLKGPNVRPEVSSATVEQSTTTVTELVLQPRVEVSSGPAGVDIQFFWPKTVTIEPEASESELLLRFAEPIDSSVADGIAEQLPGWLSSVSVGYDSMLIVATRPVNFGLGHEGAVTRITLTEAGGASADARSAEDLRLDVLRARLKARQGKTDAARSDLQDLQQTAPDNADVLVELATLEESVGSWRRAVSLYDRALNLDPNRRELASARRSLDREHGSQLRLDSDIQFVEGGDTQWITVGSGRVITSMTTEFGVRVENRWLDDDQVLRASGVTEAVSEMHQRGEVYGAVELAPGHDLEGTLLAGAGSPGAALRYDYRTPQTRTTLRLTLHRSYWELVEGIVDDALQDAIGLRHEHQLSRRWFAEAEASLNRFGIDTIDTAATSFDIGGALRYRVPWDAADLTVGYTISGRYVGAVETRRDANGNAFNPLPLTDTEFHSLDISLGDAIGSDFRYNTFLSLSADRIGDGIGPSIGGELFWEITEDSQLGLRAGHSRVSGRGDDAVFTRFGGHLLVRF
ncbi:MULTISPECIES: tetratricopeptide repeat protein [unclassified Minwuia]|jgi:tetratricopeptide (TPR) repeat protein|uniref:tetratricopeptide repeat protein n=1 Tax=unclassified Minwuia TaxID=2618799 RepID=UPI002478C6CE|nr:MULTISPECIES: tetratricopeptide repeat protein [unclassified Minwuia]